MPATLSLMEKTWGYTYGVDGVVRTEAARQMLGGIHAQTLRAIAKRGAIRKGKDPDSRVSTYCVRSLREYLARTEQ